MSHAVVGRAALVDRVVSTLRGGPAHGCTLFGPAGIGKTAVVRRVADRLSDDHDVVWIAGLTATADIPLAAFTAYLPPNESEPGISSLLAIRDALTTSIDGRRRVLVVDDAHALDETSAALLQQLIVQGMPVVLTQRSGAPASDTVTRLWRDQTLERIDVEPLDAGAVGELAADILHGDIDPRSAHEVWQRSRGNPLFVRELVLGSHAAGEWSQGPAGWRWTVGSAETPRLTDLLRDRLDRLTDEQRAALEHLAFAEPMGIGEFEPICSMAVLESLERDDLVAADVDQRRISIRFAHPLLAEVIRRSVTPLRALAVRSALVDALQATGARRRDDVMRLAILAIDAGRTVDGTIIAAAARMALTGDEHTTALRLARAAFEAERTFATGQMLADALAFDGYAHELDAHWPAWSATASTDRERGIVTMHRVSAIFYRTNDPDTALEILDAARADTPPGELADELTALSAALRVANGHVAAGRELAAPLLGATDNGRVLAQAALAMGLALRAEGAVETASSLTRNVIARLERHDGADGLIPESVFASLEAAVVLTTGRFVDALQAAERSIERAREVGAIASEGLGHMVRAEALAMSGRFRDADEAIRHAYAAVVHTDRPMYRSWALAIRSYIAALADEPTRANDSLAERLAVGLHPSRLNTHQAVIARAMIDHPDDPSGTPAFVAAEARQFEALGDLDAAIRCAHALIRLGRTELAAELTAWAGRSESPLHHLMADHGAAFLAQDADALADVADRFASCGALVFAVGAASQGADIAAQLSNEQRAKRLRLTAAAWAARFQPLLPAAPTTADREPAPVTPAAGAAGLTRREREIALLAAQGLASRAIGDRLFLSPRTVENHLGKAYAKLGVGNRAELAHVLATA